MTPAARERARREIERLCRSGLDSAALRRGILDALRRAVPFAAAYFSTTDPATGLATSGVTENLGAGTASGFFENEFFHPDFNKFSALARSLWPVGILSETTGGDLMQSYRHRHTDVELGFGDELRVAFVADSLTWGFAGLCRAEDAPCFSREEGALVAGVARTIAEGLRSSLLIGAPRTAAVEAPGIVLLDEQNNVETVNAEGEAWLAELADPFAPSDPVPGAVHGLAFATRAALDEGEPGRTSIRVRTRSGSWAVLHGSRLSGMRPGIVAVLIQPASKPQIAPLIVNAYALTKREQELTRLVLAGHATDEIASRLFISPHTVQQHLKSIFAKVGVRSRRELVAAIFDEQYFSLAIGGAPLGADGWFADP